MYKKKLIESLYLIFISILIVQACALSPPDKTREQLATEWAAKIVYIKDHRTGLCFAMFYSYGNYYIGSHIPCESIPEALLGVSSQ